MNTQDVDGEEAMSADDAVPPEIEEGDPVLVPSTLLVVKYGALDEEAAEDADEDAPLLLR